MSYTENGSVRLWWDEVGAGEPVLLIMGLAYPSDMWHRVWPALQDEYRVLRLDNRGVGKSDAPAGPYSVADMARDAVAVLDAAGIQKAHVYGASMGGGIAQELALLHPDRVASLVLACTALPDPNEPTTPKIPLVLRIIPPRILIRFAKGDYGSDVSPEAIRDDKNILRSANLPTHGLLAQMQAIAAYHHIPRESVITVPTLVLHGDADKTVPVEKGRALAAAIPGSRLEIIHGGGHNFITSVDCPANTLVKEFWHSLPALTE
jgi:3-oxoadipate enol-lactonase